MQSEQARSLVSSESDDSDITALTLDERSPETAIATTANPLLLVRKQGRATTQFIRKRSEERTRVTKALRLHVGSSKASMVNPKDRIQKLYQLHNECIAEAEQSGKGSMRQDFPTEANKKEERCKIVKDFAPYISNLEAPYQENVLFGLKRGQAFDRDNTNVTDANEDDEEPAPVNFGIKHEPEEDINGDDGSRALLRFSSTPTSRLLASMAITRSFSDASLAVNSAKALVPARKWRRINSKWMPLSVPKVRRASRKVM